MLIMHIGQENQKSKMKQCFSQQDQPYANGKEMEYVTRMKNADERIDITVDSDGFVKFTQKIPPTLDKQSHLT